MQSTFFTKADFLQSKESISTHKLKKLKFLLQKASKEAQKFEEEFLEAENFDSETCELKQIELSNKFANSFIQKAKTSPI